METTTYIEHLLGGFRHHLPFGIWDTQEEKYRWFIEDDLSEFLSDRYLCLEVDYDRAIVLEFYNLTVADRTSFLESLTLRERRRFGIFSAE